MEKKIRDQDRNTRRMRRLANVTWWSSTACQPCLYFFVFLVQCSPLNAFQEIQSRWDNFCFKACEKYVIRFQILQLVSLLTEDEVDLELLDSFLKVVTCNQTISFAFVPDHLFRVQSSETCDYPRFVKIKRIIIENGFRLDWEGEGKNRLFLPRNHAHFLPWYSLPFWHSCFVCECVWVVCELWENNQCFDPSSICFWKTAFKRFCAFANYYRKFQVVPFHGRCRFCSRGVCRFSEILFTLVQHLKSRFAEIVYHLVAFSGLTTRP